MDSSGLLGPGNYNPSCAKGKSCVIGYLIAAAFNFSTLRALRVLCVKTTRVFLPRVIRQASTAPSQNPTERVKMERQRNFRKNK
jgi:hypothetical protein